MADSKKIPQNEEVSPPDEKAHSRIISIAHTGPCLDTAQLNQLEQSFRNWVTDSPRADVRFSRRRILITFLLIRFTGAKLKEVLAVNPFTDIDSQNHAVTMVQPRLNWREPRRSIFRALCHEIRTDPHAGVQR